MTLRLVVPDRPDLAVEVDTWARHDPAKACRMHVMDGGELDPVNLQCDCGWATMPLWGFDRLYLDDLALIAAEHYRTADDPVPQPRPGVTTTT